MSILETFFACSFISTFAVALLATWLRYLPTLISFYQVVVNYLEQLDFQVNTLPKFKTYHLRRQA